MKSRFTDINGSLWFLDQCTLPAEQGTCKGNFERWAYNSETLRCEPFTWGGCGGNTNRFESESACKQRCDSPGKMKGLIFKMHSKIKFLSLNFLLLNLFCTFNVHKFCIIVSHD